jgi:2-iminobutanoate/2-iminopropanoate deaminase
MKKTIETRLAPQAIGPYSQAVTYNNMIYVSGQIGLLPQGGDIPQDFEEEAKNVFFNLKAVLEAGGSKIERVVKVTVYITDMNLFDALNKLYWRFFPENHPARETVEVSKLPKGARIEISAIGFIREDV